MIGFAAIGTAGCGWVTDQLDGRGTPDQDQVRETPVKLVWYHHFREEGARKWLEIGTRRFTESHPNVTFEIIATDGNTYMSALHNLAAVERMPDIYMVDSIQAQQEFIEAGYAMDLTGKPLVEGLNKEDLRGVRTQDGKIWALPLDRNGIGVFYNKRAFAKANIRKVPETWSEFIAVCRKLQQAGIQPIAAGYKDIWTLTADIQPDVVASGVQDPTWIQDIEAGRSSYADDRGRLKGVLRRLAERFAYVGDDPFSTGWTDALGMLASGQAAMILNGTWTIDGVRSYNPDAEIGLFAFPPSEDPADAKFAMKSTGGIVLNPKSRHSDIALEVAKFFSTPEMAAVYQDKKKGISIAADSPIDFDPAYVELDQRYLKPGKTFDYSVFYPEIVNQELLVAYQNELTLFLYDPEHDVDKCIRALDEAFNRVRPLKK